MRVLLRLGWRELVAFPAVLDAGVLCDGSSRASRKRGFTENGTMTVRLVIDQELVDMNTLCESPIDTLD
jgi:hypothetical protein